MDFVVDFRKNQNISKSFKIKISKKNGISIFVPRGCTWLFNFNNNCIIVYNVSNFYNNKNLGIRFNDPALNINWKIKPKIISEQDMSWPLLKKEKIIIFGGNGYFGQRLVLNF